MGQNKTKKATIDDVARLAGVSIKTVSRVLNNEKYVAQKTQEKVREVARSLNYQPNLQARGLAGDRSFLIGLFVVDPRGDYFTGIMRGALTQCNDVGSHLVVEFIKHLGDQEKINKILSGVRFDGVILTPPLCDDMVVIEALKSSGIPVVRIAPGKKIDGIASISINDYLAARHMTKYLLGEGHKDIALITGDLDHGGSQDRLRGFRDEMLEDGLNVSDDRIVEGKFSYESGLEAAEKLFSKGETPSAIFACNDEMAAAAISVAHKHGLNVPEDVSIVGFDDVSIATVVSPSLTTVRQPVVQMGKKAAELIHAIVKNEDGEARRQHMELAFSFIPRESLAKHK